VPGDGEHLCHSSKSSLRQPVRCRNAAAVQSDLGLPDAPLGQLPFDHRRTPAAGWWLDDEARYSVLSAGPNDRHVAQRRIADPALCAIEDIVAAIAHGPRRQV
jgi:hypothetical protein